jgi:starch synthase
MKNRLRILFLSSEVAPFAKTRGLADFSSALPKALFDLGHDIRVMMPKYGPISERKYVLREVIRLKSIPVQIGGKEHITSAKSAFIPDSKVQVYFLEYKPFFDRPEIYGDDSSIQEYPDNPERYMLFCKATLETMKLLHWEPQIIHCNDWHTALIPWLLKNDYKNDPFFERTCTLLSVHNFNSQGNFDSKIAAKVGLAERVQQKGNDLELDGKLSFLKAGLLNAGLITTVSPTFASELLRDSTLSGGLYDVVRDRKKDIVGILNGVDYSIWDPDVDAFIKEKYNATTLRNKARNKKILLEQCGLPYDETIPVIGVISRLSNQKGIDLIVSAMKEIINLNVQVVLLGIGEQKYHDQLKKLQITFRKNLAIFLRFDETLSHLIEAGSDMLLMPSRIEPCGLAQMYGLRYGTIPVVRKTGGFTDTIIDCQHDPVKGNGFVFEDYTVSAMIKTLHRATNSFKDCTAWTKLMKRGMRQDFSWKTAGEKYIKLYTKLENSKRKR